MAQDLRQAISSVTGRPGPLLSAYVSVNAAIPENQERAYLVRLRDAMNDEGVPEELQRRVRKYVEAETHPHARTLELFAAEDGLFEVYRLHVDIPESLRWGDPYVAPLTLILDEYEPYGAAVRRMPIRPAANRIRTYTASTRNWGSSSGTSPSGRGCGA